MANAIIKIGEISIGFFSDVKAAFDAKLNYVPNGIVEVLK